MADAKKVLEGLVEVQGIGAAVCVGRDGFVIESAATNDTDTDMIGAIVSTGMGSSETIGKELGVGALSQAMLEYDKGIIMLAGVGEEAILAVLSSNEASLGNVRLQIRKRVPELEKAL